MFEAADALGCWGQCGKVAYVATPIQKRPRKPNKSMAIELNDPMCEPSTLIYCLFRYRRNKPLVSALLQKLGACTRQAELRSSRTRPPSVCARHPSARAIRLRAPSVCARHPSARAIRLRPPSVCARHRALRSRWTDALALVSQA